MQVQDAYIAAPERVLVPRPFIAFILIRLSSDEFNWVRHGEKLSLIRRGRSIEEMRQRCASV